MRWYSSGVRPCDAMTCRVMSGSGITRILRSLERIQCLNWPGSVISARVVDGFSLQISPLELSTPRPVPSGLLRQRVVVCRSVFSKTAAQRRQREQLVLPRRTSVVARSAIFFSSTLLHHFQVQKTYFEQGSKRARLYSDITGVDVR